MSIQQSSVSLASLRLDGGTQPRVAISEETVAAYAEHMAALAPIFPPIVVFFDGVDHWLADGFHRYHAARKVGRESLPALIHTGTRRDAVLFAACANQEHGLNRTNADKRKAVLTLLADDEWRLWSNGEIGRRCGVSPHTVADVRAELTMQMPSEQKPRKYTTKHGTVATMKTENIGKAQHEKASDIEARLRAGEKVLDIAKALGVAPVTVAAVRKASGLEFTDKSREAVAQRRKDVRDMAERGFSTRQIASAVGLSEQAVAVAAKAEGVVIHADRVVGRTKRIDANRIVDQMVLQAEHLTADTNLIEFSDLDPEQLEPWIATLNIAKRELSAFIRRLEQEHKKHVEAA